MSVTTENYEAHVDWHQLPDGWDLVEVVGTATDSQDRVYVFNRGEHPVIVFERDGSFVGSWAKGSSCGLTGSTSGLTTPST